MADFVAVIRRAVDGLANNTPDMRAKVYEKARGAVLRQLENMKPRPSEELLRRQMDKLDAAIREVESEHAEALPEHGAPDDGDRYAGEAVGNHGQEPRPVQDVAPAAVRPIEPDPDADPMADEDDVPRGDPLPPAHQPQPYEYDEPEPPQPEPAIEEPEDDDLPQHRHETVYPGKSDPVEEDEPAVTEPGYSWQAHRPENETGRGYAHQRGDDDGVAGNVPDEPHVANDGDRDWYDDRARPDGDPDMPQTSAAKFDPQQTLDEFDALLSQHSDTPPARMPSAADFSSVAVVAGAGSAARADRSADPQPGDANPADRNGRKATDAWNDLENLIGYDKTATGDFADSTGGTGRSSLDDDDEMLPEPPRRTYHIQKKPRRSYARMVLAVIGLAVIGGGGYAVWMQRDKLNDLFGGLVESAQGNKPATTAPAATGTAQQTPPPATTSGAATSPATSPAQTAAIRKFTQRLLPDGTEVNGGPAGQPLGVSEGQSVSEKNVASTEPATPPATPENPAPATSAPGAATPATGTTPPTATPPAAASQGSERMFLYEERLGQSVPTAIQGSVVWTLEREPDSTGKPDAAVQGRINVSERGLSALITFKRNTDPSLPASHLVEIVFSVPANFEGGAIDSVQRIAMKQTEQDRGNPLVAVPARITDDFHMIALNDLPEARATNLELLRSRNWIDIPISYRNGRRALLTLQKGPEGVTAFDTALREWAAAGDGATGQ